MIEKLGDIGTWFAGVTAGIVALWVGVKSIYKMGSRINKILKLVEAELQTNSGYSLKDIIVSVDDRVMKVEKDMKRCLIRLRSLDGGPASYADPEGYGV